MIEGYTVDFSSEDDERVLNNLMFYTEKDKYTLVEEGYAENGETDLLLYELSREQLMELAADGRAKWLEQLDGPVTFDPGQKDIYTSETFGKNTYNVCVASVGEEGILGISIVNKMLITAEIPEPATASIGDGNGMVVPAGGGTSSNDPDVAELFEYIRLAAGGGTPRIAILSSSRDTLSVVENHYYFRHDEHGSLETNFEASVSNLYTFH